MTEIVPFLEDVLTLGHRSGWSSLFQRLGGFFTTAFGPEWQKGEREFWEQVQEGKYLPEPVILKE
jgi:hypothetical protein